ASAEWYDPVSATWSPAGFMTTTRTAPTATLLSNGKVLVTGGNIDAGNGFVGTNNLSSAELYDPTSNIWSSGARMATPRSFHTATLLNNGKVLTVGGSSSSSTYLSS